MFSEKYGDITKLEKSLNMAYSMVRPVNDRVYWEQIKTVAEEPIKAFLDSVKDFNYMLPASLYMEFSRTGNRQNYEKVQYMRCHTLMAYTLLEAMENDGTYMDNVVDFVWMLLEQTTWCFPAHKYLTPEADCLLPTEVATLDLFQAETGCVMAFVYALLKDKLDSVSKFITPRMVKEINFRVLDNFMERNDYWWQGFSDDRLVVNNWNPWILSNVLFCASAITEQPRRRAEIIRKVMASLDHYADVYPMDGACDEGPSYWNRAGLSLLDCTVLLYELTNGYVDELLNSKIRNTAEYITKIQIGDSYVVNFADCGAKIKNRSYGTHIKHARKVGSAALEALALDFLKQDTVPDFMEMWVAPRVMDYFEARAFETGKTAVPTYSKDTYFESTGVMVARKNEDLGGLLLAAKGGHNNESHNHNDIGHFIVYKNKIPFIIDPGYETYCAKTFSPQRYEIWTNQSGYHNVPVIAGGYQVNGREYEAENVQYETDGILTRFSLDIQKAYENSADIQKWNRSFAFSRLDDMVTVTDNFALSEPAVSTWTFMTVCDIRVEENGVTLVAENGETLWIETDLSLFDVAWETVQTTDTLIINAWGKAPTKLTLTLKQPMEKGSVIFKMQ